MKSIRYGIVGLGFVGPHHVEAVRRLGFVEIVAAAGRDVEKTRAKARDLFIPTVYGSYQELVVDPNIDVVAIATPTWLHHPIGMAAIANGKHVVVDKPLAISSQEAVELRDAARDARVVNAVTFNYRYHPVVQQMRSMIKRGELGKVRVVHGRYLQEWLQYESDFSWRLEPDKAGAVSVIGDAGAHWYDLAEFLTGLRIKSVLADLNTAVAIRKRPKGGSPEAFSTDGVGEAEDFHVQLDDLSNLLVKFDNGAVGNFMASQICAGHKNDLRIEINGSEASVAWQEERSEELWIGRRGKPNQTILKDPNLMDDCSLPYAALPGGHNEGWPDALRNLMRNIMTFIAEGCDPSTADGILFPRFEEGARVASIVDAIVYSHKNGDRWTEVAD